jgi:hypothetical protein
MKMAEKEVTLVKKIKGLTSTFNNFLIKHVCFLSIQPNDKEIVNALSLFSNTHDLDFQ